METLSMREYSEVLDALWWRGIVAWEAAAQFYEEGKRRLGDLYAVQCQATQQAYQKLVAWPGEPVR